MIQDLNAVFTEQGSSASQMTAAKVIDVISRPPGCAGQAGDAVSSYTQVKMEDAPSLLKIRNQNVQIVGYVYQDRNDQNHGPVWKIQSFLLSEICTVILLPELFWERQFDSVLQETDGKKFQIGNAFSLTQRKDYSCL